MKVVRAARELGIVESVLGRWAREAASGEGSAFLGRGVLKPEDAELAQLRKELAHINVMTHRFLLRSCR